MFSCETTKHAGNFFINDNPKDHCSLPTRLRSRSLNSQILLVVGNRDEWKMKKKLFFFCVVNVIVTVNTRRRVAVFYEQSLVRTDAIMLFSRRRIFLSWKHVSLGFVPCAPPQTTLRTRITNQPNPASQYSGIQGRAYGRRWREQQTSFLPNLLIPPVVSAGVEIFESSWC